ncbi:MAG: Rpn family recombination-promoting nuclease/putative transposase [Caldilineaceae bacterium]
MSNPHDRFFREVFSRMDLSREFLSKQLPAPIAATLDFATLALRPASFLDEELQQYFSDLLFRVNLQTGQTAYVYILLEHKSYIEWFTGLQLLRYKVEIWEQVRKEEKAKAARTEKRKKKQQRAKLPPIFPLVIYQALKRSLEIALPKEGDQVMATMAQQWLEEGKQRGWQQGLQQGARDALLTSIRSGLEARFSIDSAPLLQEIEKIQDTAQLQRLLNLLFKATSLAEFQAAYRAILAGENTDANGARLS